MLIRSQKKHLVLIKAWFNSRSKADKKGRHSNSKLHDGNAPMLTTRQAAKNTGKSRTYNRITTCGTHTQPQVTQGTCLSVVNVGGSLKLVPQLWVAPPSIGRVIAAYSRGIPRHLIPRPSVPLAIWPLLVGTTVVDHDVRKDLDTCADEWAACWSDLKMGTLCVMHVRCAPFTAHACNRARVSCFQTCCFARCRTWLCKSTT